MTLAKADLSKTKRYTAGGDFLVLRTQMSAGGEDDLRDATAPTYKVDDEGIVTEIETHANRVNGAMFAVCAIEWSLGEGRPTLQDYRELTPKSREWVDECVTDALVTVRGRAEKNARSRKRPRSSRTSSPEARPSETTPSQTTSDE